MMTGNEFQCHPIGEVSFDIFRCAEALDHMAFWDSPFFVAIMNYMLISIATLSRRQKGSRSA